MKFVRKLAIAVLYFFVVSGFSDLGAQEFPTYTTNQNAELQRDEEIHAIALNGTPEELKQVLKSGYDVNKIYLCNTLLNTAIKSLAHGQLATQFPDYAIENVKTLIEAGADVNNGGCNEALLPIEWSVVLPLQLVEKEDYINQNIDEKIKTGAEYCDFQGIVSKPCKDITLQEQELIKTAVHKSFQNARDALVPYFMETLKLLVDNGADINKKDYEGQTALHRATLNPQGETLEPLEYLIEKGADINVQDINGNTPLFVAFASGNKNAVELLIKSGADTQLRNNAGLLYNQVVGHRTGVYSDEIKKQNRF